MEKNIFAGAKFGDKFIDKSGRIYIYHYARKYKSSDGTWWTYHSMIGEPVITQDLNGNDFVSAGYGDYVNIDGIGVSTNLKYYPISRIEEGPNNKYLIVSKYQDKEDNEFIEDAWDWMYPYFVAQNICKESIDALKKLFITKMKRPHIKKSVYN